jgi:Cytochrome c554 and c-prime
MPISRTAWAPLALVVACSAHPEDPPRPTEQGAVVVPAPLLPGGPAQFAPSQASVLGGGSVRGSELADVTACANCHDDIVAEWRTSGHAFASFNNPIYRASVERFRGEAGRAPSRFCAGCHDVSLLVDGAMDGDVATTDPRASAGVTCRTCHGVVETRTDGNGSYVLAAAPIPLPDMNDPSSIARHKERAALAPLRTAELCGSCHRAFLDETTGNRSFLAGMDEYGAWSRSGYAGSRLARIDEPVSASACKDCHMPREDARLGDVSAKDGKVASHRFLGGHTWLAAMRGDGDELRREEQNLVGAASIDVAAAEAADGTRTMPADGAPVTAGERLTFDVVVRNLRVGHRFPGGTLDAEDAWIEVVVFDRWGRTLAEAGTGQEASGDDPTAHVLRAVVADDAGKPLLARETHRFRAVVYNHTIAPRDAEVVKYAFDVPPSLDRGSLPLRVVARLRHRSHDLALQRAVCDDARSRGRSSLNPCAPQPVTEIARSEVRIGEGSPRVPRPGDARPAWRRLFDHGLAEQHNVQERLEEGRPSLEAALALVETSGTDAEQAMVLGALAWLPAHEGRTKDAMEQIDRAERLAPGHAALTSLRGAALEQVWRWSEALTPLQAAAASAPRDDAVSARLAVALGSAGDDRGALAEARRGLLLSPRDPDLLRVQALSERALVGEEPDSEAAEEASLACRAADDVPAIRTACAVSVPGCALERLPVHLHVMRRW